MMFTCACWIMDTVRPVAVPGINPCISKDIDIYVTVDIGAREFQ